MTKYVVIYPNNDRNFVTVESIEEGQQPSFDKAYSTEFNTRQEAAQCAIWQAQTRKLTYQ